MSDPGQEQEQEYPQLPAGPPPAEEGVRAQNVSFVFPGKMTFSRQWMHLVGATLNERGKVPTIAFMFPDLSATVTFTDPSKDAFRGYWQSYLDGKLTAIDHVDGRREMKVKFADPPEMPHSYPPEGPDLFASNGEDASTEAADDDRNAEILDDRGQDGDEDEEHIP